MDDNPDIAAVLNHPSPFSIFAEGRGWVLAVKLGYIKYQVTVPCHGILASLRFVLRYSTDQQHFR